MIRRSNPSGLHEPPGYSHVTVVDSGRLILLAGQCPLDPAGQLVGAGDLQVQVLQVAHNVSVALASVGATPADVVRTIIYVASADQHDLSAVWAWLRASEIEAALTTASTLLGVAALGFPGQLVEVDVTAARPGDR